MKSFRAYIEAHKAEITALQILYYAPFSQRGGLGKAHQLFGEGLSELLEQLNEALVR